MCLKSLIYPLLILYLRQCSSASVADSFYNNILSRIQKVRDPFMNFLRPQGKEQNIYLESRGNLIHREYPIKKISKGPPTNSSPSIQPTSVSIARVTSDFPTIDLTDLPTQGASSRKSANTKLKE